MPEFKKQSQHYRPKSSKGPNTHGKDVFVFIVTKKDITPEGTINETNHIFADECSSKGRGCTAWVIFNENMDYLKCSDLAWNGKHKCS